MGVPMPQFTPALDDDRAIDEIAAAAPPLTEAQIERLRPIVAPLFKRAAEQLAARDG